MESLAAGDIVVLDGPSLPLEHQGVDLPPGPVTFLAVAIGTRPKGKGAKGTVQHDRVLIVCRDVVGHGCVIAVCKAIWVMRKWSTTLDSTAAGPCKEVPSRSVDELSGLLQGRFTPATLSSLFSRVRRETPRLVPPTPAALSSLASSSGSSVGGAGSVSRVADEGSLGDG